LINQYFISSNLNDDDDGDDRRLYISQIDIAINNVGLKSGFLNFCKKTM